MGSTDARPSLSFSSTFPPLGILAAIKLGGLDIELNSDPKHPKDVPNPLLKFPKTGCVASVKQIQPVHPLTIDHLLTYPTTEMKSVAAWYCDT